MTIRKIQIHVGPPKTGSTAIQSFLRKSSELGLLESNVYPLLEKQHYYAQIESGNAANWGELLRVDLTPNFDKKLFEQKISNLLNKSRNTELPVLISNEGIWHGDADRLRVFISILKEFGLDPEMLLVARRFDEVFQSQLSQTLRKGINSGVSAKQEAKAHIRRLKVWGELNIPFHVVPYSKNNLIRDFMAAVGEKPQLSSEFLEQEINSKLTASEALIISSAIGLLDDRLFVRALSQILRESYSAIPEEIRNARETEILDLVKNLEVPAPLQPRLSVEVFDEAAPSFKGTEIEEFFNLTRPNSSDCIQLTLENTPAVLGFMPGLKLSNFEWELITKSLAGVIADKERHIRNIESQLNPAQQLITVGNLQIGQDRKIGFTNKSNLVRTRIGFDPVHYLMLNPDVDLAGAEPFSHYETFGRREGRYTRITMVAKNRDQLFLEKPLLFVHTPRTGGTTFRELITAALGEENVFRSHADVSVEGEDAYSDFERIINEPAFAQSKKAIFGHFPAAVISNLGFEVNSAIFLRDPIKRAISLLQKESRDRGLPFDELLESESFVNRHLNNVQTRVLSMNLVRSDSSEPIKIDSVRLEIAIKRLQTFSFVGITDEFSESLKKFNAMFGTELEPESKAVNPSPKLRIERDVIRKLQAINEFDLILFESAKKIFKSGI